MSLIVSVYEIDRQSGTRLADINLPPGEELGGFESWRETVWGSNKTIDLGAIFLPRLKETDLYIEGEDLAESVRECQMFIEYYHDNKSVRHRLNNYIKAASESDRH